MADLSGVAVVVVMMWKNIVQQAFGCVITPRDGANSPVIASSLLPSWCKYTDVYLKRNTELKEEGMRNSKGTAGDKN